MPRVYLTRTVLARRIRERRLTFDEFIERLEVFARDNRLLTSCWLHRMFRRTRSPCSGWQVSCPCQSVIFWPVPIGRVTC